MIKSLLLDNVRCFRKPGPAPLAPLTILVGENSTGKSTFLAAVKLAHQIGTNNEAIDFNEEPFSWGAYDQIAHGSTVTKRAHSFSIGFEVHSTDEAALGPAERMLWPQSSSDTRTIQVNATFEKKGSQPVLTEWALSSGEYRLRAAPAGEGAQVSLATPSGEAVLNHLPHGRSMFSIPMEVFTDPFFYEYLLGRQLSDKPKGEPGTAIASVSPADLKVFSSLFRILRKAMPPKPYASAPIRTEPRRTYEPLKDVPRPGGGHVPMVLAKKYGAADWAILEAALERFGQESGLFKEIRVKRLGKEESSPFQILIRIAGPAFNLVDVGYGVSQALPIIVDLIQSKKGSMFLLQQPEVHLHPRAQAELGSLLCRLAKSDRKTFIVETHSDYLLDRVRMDIRDKRGIVASDVSILYFERRGTEVDIHRLEIAENGDLNAPPPGYRRFFLEEEHRFLVG